MKLRSLVPNSYIYVSVSDLYIPRIGLPIWCSKIGRPILEIYKSLTETWVTEIGRQDIIILFWEYLGHKFHFWENINRNHTFILNFHWPLICSVFI